MGEGIPCLAARLKDSLRKRLPPRQPLGSVCWFGAQPLSSDNPNGPADAGVITGDDWLAQVQLAKEVGLSVEFISLVERGVNAPSIARLEEFAKALKVVYSKLTAPVAPVIQIPGIIWILNSTG